MFTFFKVYYFLKGEKFLMRKTLAFLFVIMVSLVLVACSGGDDKSGDGDNGSNSGESAGESYTIQAAHVVSTETTQHEAFLRFQELVEEKSDGRITVDVFPDGQLGGE